MTPSAASAPGRPDGDVGRDGADRPETTAGGRGQPTRRLPWLTPEEARLYLALPSVKALYRLRERGEVRAHKLGRRLRFHAWDLDAALQPPDNDDERARR